MKNMRRIIFSLILLLASYNMCAQFYTITADGYIGSGPSSCGSNNNGLKWIKLDFSDGSTENLFDQPRGQFRNRPYSFSRRLNISKKLIRIRFRTVSRKKKWTGDCDDSRYADREIGIPSYAANCFNRNYRDRQIYHNDIRGNVTISIVPETNLNFNDGTANTSIYSACRDESVGINATSGFTPRSTIYHWQFLDPVNTATQNVPAYQALLNRVSQLERELATCVQYLTSQYGPSAASSCYITLNQARARLREYENSGLPLTMQVPVWRPIINKRNQTNIALRLSDLYANASDQTNAINKNIDIRLNPDCNGDNAISNQLTVQFLPASPSVVRTPQIAPLNCSYSTTAGFRLFFGRQVNSYEAVAINLLRKLDNAVSYVPYDNNTNIRSFNKVNNNTYTYDWRPSPGKQIKQGEYRIQVSGYRRGGNSAVPFCELYEYDFNVTAPPPVDFNLTDLQSQSCYDIDDGSIKIEVTSGGSGNYEYSLNNGSSWAAFTGSSTVIGDLAPQTYQVQLRNSRGCFARNPDESIKSIQIVINPAKEITHQAGILVPPSYPGASDATVTVEFVNGGNPFIAEGSGREFYNASILVNGVTINTTAYSTGFEIDGLPAGIHSIQYEDANGCIVNKNLPEIVDPLPITFSIQKQDPSCAEAEDGNLTLVEVNGGYPPYTLSWNKDSFPYGTGTSVVGGQGNYEVIVTDNRSVSAVQTGIRFDNLPLPLTITETLTIPTCYEGCDGSIVLNVEGGTPPYSYQWNTGDSANNLIDICANTYIVNVTDVNGCELTKTIILDNPEELILDFANHYTVCKGQSIILDATIEDTNATYLWSSTEGFNSTLPLVEILEPSKYQVVVTSSKGCQVIKEVILDNFEEFNLDLGEDITLCKDQSALLDVTIPDVNATYLWTSSNGFNSLSGIVNLTESGLYEITVTDSNGCRKKDSIYIDKTSDPISSHFFASTQVFVGEKFIVVDNSDPIPEAVDWIFPDEADVLFMDNDYAEALFNSPGEYEITLRTYRGLCKEVSTKKIIVLDQEFDDEIPSEDNAIVGSMIDYLVYPNPTNTGEFMVSVNLSKPEDVSVKIYNMINNTLIDSRKGREKKTYEFEYNIPLSSGLYFILLETSSSSEVRKLIVK